MRRLVSAFMIQDQSNNLHITIFTLKAMCYGDLFGVAYYIIKDFQVFKVRERKVA